MSSRKSEKPSRTILACQRIKDLRLKCGESQAEVANDVGISRQLYGLFEDGYRTVNVEVFFRLVEHFGVSADYLFGFSDAPSINPEMKAMCEYTGLDEIAIESLHRANVIYGKEENADELRKMRNMIVQSPEITVIPNDLAEIETVCMDFLSKFVPEPYDDFYLLETMAAKLNVQKNVLEKAIVNVRNEECSDYGKELADSARDELDKVYYRAKHRFERIVDRCDYRRSVLLFNRKLILNIIGITEDDLKKAKEEILQEQKGSTNE